ncbi:glycosyltransferase [Planctomycetota bacterium]
MLLLLYFKKRYVGIQVNTMPDFLVFATLIPKLCGVKVILDMHEAMPELFRSKFYVSKKHFLVKLVKMSEHFSVRYADYVLVVGESILDLYLSRGLSRSKTTIIPNAPDERLFDFKKYPRTHTKVRKRKFVVISHGTILKRYGYQVLIRAVPLIKQSIPDLSVVIVGDGDYLVELKDLARKLKVCDCVSYMGLVPFERIPLEISKADVGIVPILKDEFTDFMAPNKLFEYVAMKKPVIASRIRGIQDYFDDSCLMFFESGIEEELAKCVIELYKMRKKTNTLNALIKNAWLSYEKIRWNRTKNIYCSIYTNILKCHVYK